MQLNPLPQEVRRWLVQRTLTVGGMITVQLVSSLKRLDLTNKENMLLFVYSEAVKLETSSTVILPPYSECSLHGALS